MKIHYWNSCLFELPFLQARALQKQGNTCLLPSAGPEVVRLFDQVLALPKSTTKDDLGVLIWGPIKSQVWAWSKGRDWCRYPNLDPVSLSVRFRCTSGAELKYCCPFSQYVKILCQSFEAEGPVIKRQEVTTWECVKISHQTGRFSLKSQKISAKKYGFTKNS